MTDIPPPATFYSAFPGSAPRPPTLWQRLFGHRRRPGFELVEIHLRSDFEATATRIRVIECDRRMRLGAMLTAARRATPDGWTISALRLQADDDTIDF